MPIQPISKQNRPYLRMEHEAIALPADFALVCDGISRQEDREITHLHRHNCLELGYCHRGSGIFVVDQKILPFKQDDIILITPAEMHLAQSSRGTVSEWTWLYCDPVRLLTPMAIDPHICDLSGFAGAEFCNVMSPDSMPALNQIVHTIVDECVSRKELHRETVRGLLYALFCLLRRAFPTEVATNRPTAHRPDRDPALLERIHPAIELIRNRFAGEVRLPDLAAACFMSVTNFRRVFTRALGRSPQEYMLAFRIHMAAGELRNTANSVGSIAAANGFPTVSAFNRKFKMMMDATPRQYRTGGAG